ncbi:anaerobic ribonucleoside-triphosphate reductase activating protein [Corynebacterium sp. ES2794-CONJ1]|uniref:anaerobic ribonucleoside-triphosphate reductase activating protein n=1 Tax=unclassified Corynebacterium TaxID=2624378 RepID=UPI00216AC756|nr:MULTISPECIES: anaerobic ribonucleoside-triphosphate reductase activating protein [unclassified Corynebacterium]MCS4531587.1 anaerobic ribonucleoside-triphosphate reductase activating protein [Corynebacterium sp. ES2730-CONJ]MCU9518983.1 anaerobic ribonucleoside-triphosphate reductase activating protein [Corynebacterium sp. ES2794-CONJ1]
MSASTLTKPSSKSLPVAGIIPFSATDWPGNITLTVFTQGCPLRCVYCHNPNLQPLTRGALSFDTALDQAATRRALLDGIVISGGEPTLSSGLGPAIAKAHQEGFAVGLHTCGYSPAAIRRLLQSPDSTPDWVGLDIKALPDDMEYVIQRPAHIGNRCWESMHLFDEAGVDMQVRTTIFADSPLEHHLSTLAEKVEGYGHELVIQHARAADGSPFVLH